MEEFSNLLDKTIEQLKITATSEKNMTNKETDNNQKTPGAEKLNDADLDQVQGGLLVDDIGIPRGGNFKAGADLASKIKGPQPKGMERGHEDE